MKSKILSIVGVLMIGLIFVGCGNSVVKKSIEQAKNAIESKEYDKALASLELALDEDKDNEEANKIYSIVDGYQKSKKLVDENKIIEAKKLEEEKKHQQSSEKRYYVPHLNKSLTMDEMSDEFNKISRPFDYVGDNGITYMFNPWSTKPTEPAY